MNLPTIEVNRSYARDKMQEYAAALDRRSDAEYVAARMAYEAAAEGYALIQLGQAVVAAGLDEKHRPRIAIARADRKQVCFGWTGDRHMRFDSSMRVSMWGDRDGALQIDVPWDGHDIPESRWNRKRGYALVPMIPPEVRRGLRNGNGSRCRKHAASNDRKRFILWEVDEWSDTRLRSQPDRDPLLLEHLHGEMYIVLAQWDLTEIERMVMLGRRS